jgi:hypothetical protein
MMLTYGLPSQGNGIFTIHAVAHDQEGNIVTLGTKTISCDNLHATKPFGTIDTPSQGGEGSGIAFINFGWALTPLPKAIPSDGSTIGVYVDGQFLGHSVYGQYRSDIAAAFPGYANSSGAVGYFYINTTQYEDGVHTIGWIVEDSAGYADGIGSRFFTIVNGASAGLTQRKKQDWDPVFSQFVTPESTDTVPLNYQLCSIVRGYAKVSILATAASGGDRVIRVALRETERVEIHFGDFVSTAGYLIVGKELRSLPIGSSLDIRNGVFSWQPGPGHIGKYEFLFLHQDKEGAFSKTKISILIEPAKNIRFSFSAELAK